MEVPIRNPTSVYEKMRKNLHVSFRLEFHCMIRHSQEGTWIILWLCDWFWLAWWRCWKPLSTETRVLDLNARIMLDLPIIITTVLSSYPQSVSILFPQTSAMLFAHPCTHWSCSSDHPWPYRSKLLFDTIDAIHVPIGSSCSMNDTIAIQTTCLPRSYPKDE